MSLQPTQNVHRSPIDSMVDQMEQAIMTPVEKVLNSLRQEMNRILDEVQDGLNAAIREYYNATTIALNNELTQAVEGTRPT
ncbi:hypothetical protein FGADI_6685 [Fusarium gaditjirri]|uniref:Uncharacterized protein n=1 Tax=Fusarium gaditjirri TaxID=282569 RepID=A0A8H4T7D4_9HYPO|nr:hypothetical protein FGADI_6685 [Fusarium gaditjirri]